MTCGSHGIAGMQGGEPHVISEIVNEMLDRVSASRVRVIRICRS
jgi:hypothetical protein